MNSDKYELVEIRETLALYNNPIWFAREMGVDDANTDRFVLERVAEGGWVSVLDNDFIVVNNLAGYCQYVYLEVCFSCVIFKVEFFWV
jgi:hypothetical protein